MPPQPQPRGPGRAARGTLNPALLLLLLVLMLLLLLLAMRTLLLSSQLRPLGLPLSSLLPPSIALLFI